jgi:hypothetical protein
MTLRAKSFKARVAAAVLLVFAIEQFIFCSYPRFQIPLLYLAGFLAVPAVCRARREHRHNGYLLVAALAAATVIGSLWFTDVVGLLRELSSFAYPGRVSSTGGTFAPLSHFASFLEFGMTEYNFPKPFGNACEAAGFVFLLPILVAVVLRQITNQNFDAPLIATTAFLVLVACFMSVGIPESLARWTGWWAVIATRANVALGLGSVIALVRYFAIAPPAVPSRLPILTFAFAALLLYAILLKANLALAAFVSRNSIVAASLFFALVYVAVWRRQTAVCCALLLFPLVCANGLTNPISYRLPGFTATALSHAIHDLHESDPAPRWLVLGHSDRAKLLAQYAKAAGADVVGGVRCNPDRAMVHVLDPKRKYRDIYERYAEITFLPTSEPEPRFELTFVATYNVYLPITGDFISRLGVRYIIEPDPDPTTIAGFDEIESVSGCRILRAR